MAARLRLEGALLRCCRATVPVLSAAVALGARCLSGAHHRPDYRRIGRWL